MKIILLFYFTFSCLLTFSQNRKTDKILEEGKLLYRLEKASWYGTDDMLVRFKTKKDSVGGYLSYETSDNKINTIFFSRYNPNKILVRYQFDSLPKKNPIKIDTLNQKPTELESDLIAIRQDAKNRVYENADNFFSFYQNTAMNFIPLIKDNDRKVFVLTGPKTSGFVLIGNDYVLNYNRNNNFKDKAKIHNSILQFPYKSKKGESSIETSFHSHVITDYISSTDICTLLLYKDYIEWKQHIVISEKKVSIFNLENGTLFTMKTEDWKKLKDNKK